MTTCPTCQRPVDPLRAPVVGVRDGKVVSFCSKECASGASVPVAAMTAAPAEAAAVAEAPAPAPKKRARTHPPKAPPRTPAEGVPTITPSDGVPKRATPAGGVPKRATPADGVPKRTTPAAGIAALDSGPVIEIIREASSRSSGIPEEPPIQVSETGRIDDYVDVEAPPQGRRSWLAVVLVVLALGAAAAYLVLSHRSSSHAAVAPPAATGTAQPEVPEPPPAAAPSPPPVDPAAALVRAKSLLQVQLGSTSPRIQRIAALALARTGDPGALAHLTADLATEPSDIAKLDIDYGLARATGSDPAVAAASKRGADALVAALAPAMRRDVRAEAAARLVRLGDARGIPTLATFLDISQQRLGAAKQLAPLAEPRALKVLDEIRADAAASADDRADAVIALGVAGAATGAAPVAPDITAALHALLPDPRFAPMAAAALAGLGDAAARAPLVKELAIPSLRVDAARALRRLDPKLDAAPLLPGLLAALGSGKDTDEISAAEAILLLAGPPAWSAHP